MMQGTKKFMVLFLVLCTLALAAAGCGKNEAETKSSASSSGTKTEIFVSAAASMTDAMKELAAVYGKAHPGITITYNFGASGALQTQIEEGAPADLFVSAAQKQMDNLDKKDLIVKDSRKDLLVNKVVLITGKENKAGLKSFEDVTSDKVKVIALGEPKGVPVGQYSEEIFTKLGMLDAVKAKASYGSDVRQVLDWVEHGEADCGVVYATDAAISKDVKVIAEAPAGSHKPVIYPAAVLKNSGNKEAAAEFLTFLSSKEAAAIFEKYGFQMK